MPLLKNLKEKIESIGSKEDLNKIEKIIRETVRTGREKPVERTFGEKAGKEAIEEKSFEIKEGETKGELVGMTLTPIAQQQIREQEKKIEKILEENLEEIYLTMPPEKQREFKIAGEQTIRQINNILEKTKFKIKDIINLIKKWLSIIPGMNKFFIEQEAKIKADKIIKLKNFKS